MSVIIYTYRDPYKLKENKELWKEISSCPYFCAAQTLVNGLKAVYGAAFQIGRVTTVKNLTDVLYEKWNGTACAVKQHADIDNIIVNSSDITGISGTELDNVKKSFLFNRDEVFTSIRTMFELKMEPQNIVDKYLTPEQRFIVSVYKKIRASEKAKDFCLEQDFTEEQINQAITKAMTTAKDNSSTKNEIEVETLNHIVIHGVHQFSPLLLRAVEEIAKYKKVILLINYQEQYKNIYQTWIDIYSAFDCEIQNFDGVEYYPVDVSAVSYDGNLLAYNIGKLIGGHKEDISVRKPYEIIEFDNMTEFTGHDIPIETLSIDHFVPRSYISNDELWNLIPMRRSLNSSKNNRLPFWDEFFGPFARYQFYLYGLIFPEDSSRKSHILISKFERCRKNNINAIWASENLYIPGNSDAQFVNILSHNLKPIYESAQLQGYDTWKIKIDQI